jgi:hypothetical protein
VADVSEYGPAIEDSASERPAGESPASGPDLPTGELFLYHRELKPEDLKYVLSPVPDYPYVNSLGTHANLPEAGRFREWFDENVGPDATMAKVLATDFTGAI